MLSYVSMLTFSLIPLEPTSSPPPSSMFRLLSPRILAPISRLALRPAAQQPLLRSFSTKMDEKELRNRLNAFQDMFVEARLCIEDVVESAETTYFDEDAEEAQRVVGEAVACFEGIVNDIEDKDQKNSVLRGNGLKVEQLKGELQLALDGGHAH